MAKPILRGLKRQHEQDPSRLVRDTRTWSQRIADFFKSPLGVSVSLITLGGSSYIVPSLADIVFLVGISMFLIAVLVKAELPFRVPMWAKRKDYGNTKAGSKKAELSNGIYFFGNEKDR